jgi:hypothetical protein
MPSIQIDDEVFEVLQRNAKPFLDSPNTVLRRLLGLGAQTATDAKPAEPDALEQLMRESTNSQRTKAAKADLAGLVRVGLLREGERLFLVDYQGKRVPQHEAVVAGGMLAHKGRHYTMSNLAQTLLKKVGFKSNSVRGPSHWANAKGTSVTALWQQLGERNAAK